MESSAANNNWHYVNPSQLRNNIPEWLSNYWVVEKRVDTWGCVGNWVAKELVG